MSRPPSPQLTKGYFSTPHATIERFIREEASDWASAFTLLDTIETYFDSHVDLLQRRLQKHSDRLKMKAEETKFKLKDFSGDVLAENFDREIKNFKVKVSARMTKLAVSWQSAKVVRTREKVSFFLGVMTLLFSALMFGLAPQHFYPNSVARFPALAELPYLQPLRALLLSGGLYVIWQLLYWKFILIDRRSKIESGERTTSFSYLLNDKRGVIGVTLSSVSPRYREAFFMGGQLVYAVLTELPAVFLLYDSPLWSGIFLIFIFSVSAWNGGGFYIEVFGRKFEREMEALRKELAEVTARSGASTPALYSNHSDSDLSSLSASPEPPAALDLSTELAPQPDPSKKNI
ncbi:hypothetical protein C0989_010812 [Termitomyces sp. Mn162]|nr:hypothetical protein C0989_010812 [Termitomyces sp. Mn162]